MMNVFLYQVECNVVIITYRQTLNDPKAIVYLIRLKLLIVSLLNELIIFLWSDRKLTRVRDSFLCA